MITPELVTYIKTERAKGTPDASIKSTLLSNGWSEADLNEAFSAASGNASAPKPVSSIDPASLRKYQYKKMWALFVALSLIDALIILLMDGHGLFGISLPSIIIRVIVILAISFLATRTLRPSNSPLKSIGELVLRSIAAVIVIVGLSMGLFFLYCLFLVRF